MSKTWGDEAPQPSEGYAMLEQSNERVDSFTKPLTDSLGCERLKLSQSIVRFDDDAIKPWYLLSTSIIVLRNEEEDTISSGAAHKPCWRKNTKNEIEVQRSR